MKLKQFERYGLIIIIITLTILNYLYIGKAKKMEGGYLDDIEKNEAANTYIWQNSLLSSDLPLGSSILIEPHSLDTISVPSFCKKPTLVLMLSKYSCEVCVDSIFSAIKSFNLSEQSELCVFFVSEDLRSAQAEIFQRKLTVPVYLLISTNCEIPAVTSGFSFFFYLDADCKTKYIFIPDKNNNAKTLWYLNFIRKTLSGNCGKL